MDDYISRADAIELLTKIVFDEPPYLDSETLCRLYAEEQINTLPSAEAVTIHEDGTLKVKVPNAHKVGRVLVMDTDSHIGGGLFYQDDAEQGEWICKDRIPLDGAVFIECECSVCGEKVLFDTMKVDNFCGKCGARMKGGAE